MDKLDLQAINILQDKIAELKNKIRGLVDKNKALRKALIGISRLPGFQESIDATTTHISANDFANYARYRAMEALK